MSLTAGIIQQLFKKFLFIELKINMPYSLGADVMLRTDGPDLHVNMPYSLGADVMLRTDGRTRSSH